MGIESRGRGAIGIGAHVGSGIKDVGGCNTIDQLANKGSILIC